MKRRSSEFFQSRCKRTKTYRKKIKRELKQRRARNKRLISKYPWLRAVDWYSMTPMPDPNYDFCSIWDDLPRGWVQAFGRQMCDELEEEFEKYNAQNILYVEQAKEKYGGMRLYMSTVGEAQGIIDKYEAISESICVRCGRPHTPMLALSWISPYCKTCFEYYQKKDKYWYQKPYEEFVPNDKEKWKTPYTLTWRKYKDGERTEETMDITETVKNIERNWNKLHPDRANEWFT